MKNCSPESDFCPKISFIYSWALFLYFNRQRERICGSMSQGKLIKCILRAWTSWKMSWIAEVSGEDTWENCTCSTTQKKRIRNWMPLKCLMSSKISGASMHFCLWFIPFFVCSLSHACENISGVFTVLPRSLSSCFASLLVESCCAYFHCDSIQSSRFAWFHRTFRNFLDGNRILLKEMKFPRMFDINSKC